MRDKRITHVKKAYGKPPNGFIKKVGEFIELTKEKGWSIADGFSSDELRAKFVQVAELESDFKKTEAEYRAKKYALQQEERALFIQFQTALKILSARFYRDIGILRLLDNFRKNYSKRKKEMPETVEVS